MPHSHAPRFYDLPPDESRALLARNHVGRLAYTFHDRVDMEPISYAFADGWLYGRTSAGAKLTTIRHHQWVVFETDEVAGRYDWKSVVVHGALYVVEDHEPHREAYRTLLAAIRSVEPQALTADDPTPQRTVIVRVHIDDIIGRAATTHG
jgi:uncharacterized protein